MGKPARQGVEAGIAAGPVQGIDHGIADAVDAHELGMG